MPNIGVAALFFRYTLEEKTAYLFWKNSRPSSRGGYTEKTVPDIVLSGVSKRSVEVSPRPSNSNKHNGLMATLLRENPHSSRSAAIVPPNDAMCRHYNAERQRIMIHWRHFDTLIRQPILESLKRIVLSQAYNNFIGQRLFEKSLKRFSGISLSDLRRQRGGGTPFA